jgi:molecular chaperone GrpE
MMMTDENERISELNEPELDEVAIWKDKYIRILADMKNTQNRLARSSAQEVEADKKSILRDVLPVADGLDLALIHLSHEEDTGNIVSGVKLIRKIMEKFFTKYDVEVIDAWGEPFDPTMHEAVGVLSHSEFPPNTVVRVEQKGYLYRDTLLRPARVQVSSK